WKYFACRGGKNVLLLNAKIVTRQIQVHVDRVSDWRDVARPMPCRADVEKLAAGGDLPRHVQTARGGNVDPDEVDQPFGHKKNPLVAVHEQLAHGNRATGLLPQRLKPGDILGREGIFHEERSVRLDCLAKLNSLVRRNTLVDVMQEFDVKAQLVSQ